MGIIFKSCEKCERGLDKANFIRTDCSFFPDKHVGICNVCLARGLMAAMNKRKEWEFVDKFCQWIDIPFIPSEWTKLAEVNREKTLPIYAAVMQGQDYSPLSWNDMNNKYIKLKEKEQLEEITPLLRENYFKELSQKWGLNYDEEQLEYLENLYEGIHRSHHVRDNLQENHAKQLCKISLLIEEKIRAGEDFDKLLGSYDKVIQITGFIPKNSQNSGDFESMGELIAFLEKRGWVNQYYDKVPKDIVDTTIKNIQKYSKYLYTNESTIPEEIERKVEILKNLQKGGEVVDSFAVFEDAVDESNEFFAEDEEEFRSDSGWEQ